MEVLEISVCEADADADGVEVVGFSELVPVGIGTEVDGSSEPIAVGIATVVGAAVEEASLDDAGVLVVEAETETDAEGEAVDEVEEEVVDEVETETEVEGETVDEAATEVEGEIEVEASLVLTADVEGAAEDGVDEAEVDRTADDSSDEVELATEVAEVGAADVLVPTVVADGDNDGEEAALEGDAFEVVTEGVAGLACAVDGMRVEDMEGTASLLDVHVPSEEEWAPSRFNAGDLKKGAMAKKEEEKEKEKRHSA